MIIFSKIYPEINLRFEIMALMEDLKALKFGDLDQLSNLMRTTRALAQRDQIREKKIQKHIQHLQNLKTHLTHV